MREPALLTQHISPHQNLCRQTFQILQKVCCTYVFVRVRVLIMRLMFVSAFQWGLSGLTPRTLLLCSLTIAFQWIALTGIIIVAACIRRTLVDQLRNCGMSFHNACQSTPLHQVPWEWLNYLQPKKRKDQNVMAKSAFG